MKTNTPLFSWVPPANPRWKPFHISRFRGLTGLYTSAAHSNILFLLSDYWQFPFAFDSAYKIRICVIILQRNLERIIRIYTQNLPVKEGKGDENQYPYVRVCFDEEEIKSRDDPLEVYVYFIIGIIGLPPSQNVLYLRINAFLQRAFRFRLYALHTAIVFYHFILLYWGRMNHDRSPDWGWKHRGSA